MSTAITILKKTTTTKKTTYIGFEELQLLTPLPRPDSFYFLFVFGLLFMNTDGIFVQRKKKYPFCISCDGLDFYCTPA